MSETEYKRTSALCTGCGTANPPHELWKGACLKCVGKERDELLMSLCKAFGERNDLIGQLQSANDLIETIRNQ